MSVPPFQPIRIAGCAALVLLLAAAAVAVSFFFCLVFLGVMVIP